MKTVSIPIAKLLGADSEYVVEIIRFKEHWYHIREDPTLSAICPKEPFFALQKHKSIKDILVTIKLKR